MAMFPNKFLRGCAAKACLYLAFVASFRVQVKHRKAPQALSWYRRLPLTPDRVLQGLKKA
jgi:hypothetical protein